MGGREDQELDDRDSVESEKARSPEAKAGGRHHGTKHLARPQITHAVEAAKLCILIVANKRCTILLRLVGSWEMRKIIKINNNKDLGI